MDRCHFLRHGAVSAALAELAGAPGVRVAKGAPIVCLTPELPPRTFKDLVAYAKANPGKLNFAIDLMSGEIQGFVEPALGAMPHVMSGRIRAVAVTSAGRVSTLPDVPTVAESGVPGFEFYAWYGLWAPGRTADPVVTLLNREVNKILAEAELRNRLGEQGFETQSLSPAEFGRFVQNDFESVGQISRDAKINVQSGSCGS